MFTKIAPRVAVLAATVAMLLTAQSASAATTQYTKLYKGTTGYTGAYNGAGTIYDATKNLSTICPTGHAGCSGDVLGTTLSFVAPGPDFTTSVNVLPGTPVKPNKVWDDLSPNFGGLGVGTGDPSDTDQIAGSDVLTLTFTEKTILTGVGTLFASGHTSFGANFSTVQSVINKASLITFLLSVDGGAFNPVKFADANNNSLLLMGKTFSFKNNGSANPDYYISAVATAPVPVPAALPLLATALGGLVRMRRAKA